MPWFQGDIKNYCFSNICKRNIAFIQNFNIIKAMPTQVQNIDNMENAIAHNTLVDSMAILY